MSNSEYIDFDDMDRTLAKNMESISYTVADMEYGDYMDSDTVSEERQKQEEQLYQNILEDKKSTMKDFLDRYYNDDTKDTLIGAQAQDDLDNLELIKSDYDIQYGFAEKQIESKSYGSNIDEFASKLTPEQENDRLESFLKQHPELDPNAFSCADEDDTSWGIDGPGDKY